MCLSPSFSHCFIATQGQDDGFYSYLLDIHDFSPLVFVCRRAVPKFMKRIKVRDYKDRNVFGVPLQVIVQRTGQPLPQGIQQAMRFLRSQCLDQVGEYNPLKHTLIPAIAALSIQ